MKRSILVILVTALAFTLAGCGSGTNTTAVDKTIVTTIAPDGTKTTITTAPDGSKITTITAVDGTVTTTTTPPPPPISAKLNSVAFANNSSAVINGIYSLSNPGAIKIDYDLTSTVVENAVMGYTGAVRIVVSFSNFQSIDNIWLDSGSLQQKAQELGSTYLSGSGTKNTIGSLTTINGSNQMMIESPASRATQQYPYAFEAGLDFTKPMFVLVTAYTLDSTIPYQNGVPTTYISSQVALPITIVP